MRHMMERWTSGHPWLVIFLLTAMVAAAASGAGKLYFRGDYKIFFEDGYGPLNDFQEMQHVFNKRDNIAVLIVPESGDVMTADMLELVKEYTEAAWQTPFSSRVDSISNFQHTWSEEDDMMVDNLVPDGVELTPEVRERIRGLAVNEPALRNSLISPDSRVTMININTQMPDNHDNTANVIEVSEFVHGLSDQFAEKYPGVKFYHTGVIPINYSFATEGQKDMTTLIPAMLLLIVVLLALMLRSPLAMLATVTILVMTIMATMGLGGWLGFFLSTGTINVPIVVLTIAVADCVHIVASMQYAQRQGQTRREAVAYSLRLNWMPIFITSATTAVGFLTLMMSESPVFVDFGVLSAIGVMLAYLLSVTLFPALLVVLPIGQGKAGRQQSALMDGLANFVIRRQKPLLIFGSVLAVGIGALSLNNDINDVSTEYFAKSTEFRQSVDKRAETLSGTQSIDFALYTGEEGGANDPQFIRIMRDFSAWLLQQPEVDHVATLSDTFKRLNMNMHGDDRSWYEIPDDRELAAQYLLLYEMSLPYGLDLNNQLNIDKSAVRLTVTVKNFGSREMVDLEERAREWMTSNGPDVRLTAASPGLMFAHIGETNMKSMIKSIFLAFVIISGILVVALKSVRLGLISLLPNILPALVGFGFWSLISGEINLALSIVSSMTLGIIVDDTVHFLSKYQYARKDGMDAEAAVRYAFASVGRALLITTIVLALGFSMLMFSAFRLNSDMGMATSLVIVIALIIDFLLLPPMLLWLDGRQKDENTRSPHASTH
ncbi:MAG TPA: RND transporter [Oceanospirillales bacterium]|nr:RND transporter [Oceanospirillaceae bacterium]MAR02244.1 RND transporter [Oceanospirillaceae bacterium]HBS42791.1 RND transporter [Oceanospirillales bacterium]